MKDKVLVTGGAGFIGSHIVDILIEFGHQVGVVDRLSMGGSVMNLEHHDDVNMMQIDLGTSEVDFASLLSNYDLVIHAAAESHVDRSIDNPRQFIKDNIMSTQTVLDAVVLNGTRMLMISTDEVYGQRLIGQDPFKETNNIAPRSPYAASKAAADILCQSYITTYDADITIVRGTNAYGPRQIEKVIPTYILNALDGKPLPVYGKGQQMREYLYVRDWAKAAIIAMYVGEKGAIYNIGGGHEISNIDLAKKICSLTGADEGLITFVTDRLGHDFRYGVDCSKLKTLGWHLETPWEDGIARTVDWYRGHKSWLKVAHTTGKGLT